MASERWMLYLQAIGQSGFEGEIHGHEEHGVMQ